MATRLDTGKTVGRVSIRVLPDTKDFKKQLERQLKRQSKNLRQSLTFDRARVDREKIRESISKQMEHMGSVPLNTDVSARVTKATVDRQKVRQSLREEFDKMNLRVKIYAKIANPQELDDQVKRMVDRAERHQFNLDQDVKFRASVDRKSLERVSDQLDEALGDEFQDSKARALQFMAKLDDTTKFEERIENLIRDYDGTSIALAADLDDLVAKAQLKWTTRDRFVSIFVKVSKASLATAAKQIATLAAAGSGGRLAFDWIQDITDGFRDLDRNTPMILTVTSALTAAFAALMAAGSGLVGIGGDLARIGPAFLVIPGLILNAIASASVLFVALRDSKKELAELSDDMQELGDIISRTFWDRAQEPIVQMMTTLLPGLRSALGDTADATGGFAAEMARAFERELGGGRLESIFAGINESWDILASGADGFAGAIVNLSEIAAKYMPDLAQWFSDLAADFNQWLTDISTSDQLDTWIKNAVFEMNELWRATENAWGFLQALYDAANKAGGTGLTGLADMLGAWKDVANSADFQRGLVAIFRGSYEAMEAFGEAVKAIGRLIADNDQAFENFIASAGGFIAGIGEGIADALNSPTVMDGLNEFSDGLTRGLAKIKPELQPLADTFGTFLGLLGTVAGDTLPSVVEALGNLTPALDAFVEPMKDGLPGLGDALVKITEALGPALEDLAGALGEATIAALTALADAIVAVAPLITPLIQALADFVAGIAPLISIPKELGNILSNDPTFEDYGITVGLNLKMNEYAKEILGGELTVDVTADLNLFMRGVGIEDANLATELGNAILNPESEQQFRDAADTLAGEFVDTYEDVLSKEGKPAADLLFRDIMSSSLPTALKNTIRNALEKSGYEQPIQNFSMNISEELYNSLDRDLQPVFGMFVDQFGSNGLDAAQALWDSFDSETQDSKSMQKLLDVLHEEGIKIVDEMGTAGSDAAAEFGEGLSGGGGGGGGVHPMARNAAGALRRYMERQFDSIGEEGNSAGSKAAKGLASGINQNRGRAGRAAQSLVADALLDKLRDVDRKMMNIGRGGVSGLASGMRDRAGKVGKASSDIRKRRMVGPFDGVSRNLNNVGKKASNALESGLRANAGGVRGASGQLASAARGPVGNLPSRMKNIGGSAGSNLGSGLASKRGSGKYGAQQLRKGVMAGLNGLGRRGTEIGQGFGKNLGSGLGSKRKSARWGGQELRSGLMGALSGITRRGTEIGSSFGRNFGSGLGSRAWQARDNGSALKWAAINAAGGGYGQMHAIGVSLGRAIADGIRSQAGAVSAAANYVRQSANAPSGGGREWNDPPSKTPPPINPRSVSIQVTQPMLPGETPAEQRDNVSRELRDIFA